MDNLSRVMNILKSKLSELELLDLFEEMDSNNDNLYDAIGEAVAEYFPEVFFVECEVCREMCPPPKKPNECAICRNCR